MLVVSVMGTCSPVIAANEVQVGAPSESVAGDACPAVDSVAASDQDRVEYLTDEDVDAFNKNLIEAGNVPLHDDVVALEFREDDSVVEKLADGEEYLRPRSVHNAMPLVAAGANSVTDEIKRAVGACLGVSLNATNFWKSFVEELSSWDKAVKFVVRRIGVVGAVSCLGGIVWEYI